MVEDSRLLGRTTHGPRHQLVNLGIEVLVARDPDGVEDSSLLQVLVDVRRGE